MSIKTIKKFVVAELAARTQNPDTIKANAAKAKIRAAVIEHLAALHDKHMDAKGKSKLKIGAQMTSTAETGAKLLKIKPATLLKEARKGTRGNNRVHQIGRARATAAPVSTKTPVDYYKKQFEDHATGYDTLNKTLEKSYNKAAGVGGLQGNGLRRSARTEHVNAVFKHRAAGYRLIDKMRNDPRLTAADLNHVVSAVTKKPVTVDSYGAHAYDIEDHVDALHKAAHAHRVKLGDATPVTT